MWVQMVIHMGDIFPAGYWVNDAGCLQFGSYPLICKTKFWTMQKLGVEFHLMLCQVSFSTLWSCMIGGLRNRILSLVNWLTIDWQLNFWGDFVVSTEMGIIGGFGLDFFVVFSANHTKMNWQWHTQLLTVLILLVTVKCKNLCNWS